ncbi:MAG TPA: guanylate kinase [Candidatus Kapabacteria bacterium]|nr:guanylate kinase [Candidatus Kapabacteria bacterium]
MSTPHNGTLVVISAPSGGGKNVIIRSLLERFKHATQLVTTTTRPPREGEVDGVDYHFITKEAFLKKVEQGEFVEYNQYVDNYYGTEWDVLEHDLATHAVVFSQAEVTGKQNLDRAQVPHISIFLLPENFGVLEARLRRRGGMKEEDIVARLEIAKQEIEVSSVYDYRIVNAEGKLNETIDAITSYLAETCHIPLLDKEGRI